MKYYFITYKGTNTQGGVSIWNQVIDVSPMYFIKDVELSESAGSQRFNNFVVLNTCKITKEEFDKYDGHF